MADEYKVIHVLDSTTAVLEEQLNTASADRYEWVDVLTSRSGGSIIVMKRTKYEEPATISADMFRQANS